jgi:hypothetical protein
MSPKPTAAGQLVMSLVGKPPRKSLKCRSVQETFVMVSVDAGDKGMPIYIYIYMAGVEVEEPRHPGGDGYWANQAVATDHAARRSSTL